MGSVRMLLCDLCLAMLLGYVVVADKSTKSPDDGPRGNCTCGGFASETPEVGAAPLISQSPGLIITCDQEGAGTCRNLCIALATAAKAKGPEVLCSRLVNAEELKLSAFFKACDMPWIFANMTAENPLCCEKSNVKTCTSTETANATQSLTTGKPAIL